MSGGTLSVFSTLNHSKRSKLLTRHYTLNEKINEKRPWNVQGTWKVKLLHDNARPHVAIQVIDTINELEWDLMPHAAYSPDLAPSDYHLFRSLEHSLRNKSFANPQDVKKHLDSFFESKPASFYREGIQKLQIQRKLFWRLIFLIFFYEINKYFKKFHELMHRPNIINMKLN